MNDNGMSAADVMALSNGGFGGWEGLIYLAVIASMFGGGFGFGGLGNNGAAAAMAGYATQSDMQRGFDNQNQMANQREILSTISDNGNRGIAATNQVFHDILGAFNDKYSELQRDISDLAVGQANLTAKQNDCCGETKMLIAEAAANLSKEIAQNKYEQSLALAGLEQRLTSKMDQNEIQKLRDEVSDLRLNQAMCGVMRYPNSASYNAGPWPPSGGNGCPCNTQLWESKFSVN